MDAFFYKNVLDYPSLSDTPTAPRDPTTNKPIKADKGTDVVPAQLTTFYQACEANELAKATALRALNDSLDAEVKTKTYYY